MQDPDSSTVLQSKKEEPASLHCYKMASFNQYTQMDTALLPSPPCSPPSTRQSLYIYIPFHHHLGQKNIASNFKKTELLYELVPLSQETQVFQGSSLGTDNMTNLLAQSPRRRNLLSFCYVDFHSESEKSILHIIQSQPKEGSLIFTCKPVGWNERREVICTWLQPVMTLNYGQSRLVMIIANIYIVLATFQTLFLALCINY